MRVGLVWLVEGPRGTKADGISLRGSGVATTANTCSVSAVGSGGESRRAGKTVPFRDSRAYMAAIRDTLTAGCSDGVDEALNVMCKGSDHGEGGRGYIWNKAQAMSSLVCPVVGNLCWFASWCHVCCTPAIGPPFVNQSSAVCLTRLGLFTPPATPS